MLVHAGKHTHRSSEGFLCVAGIAQSRDGRREPKQLLDCPPHHLLAHGARQVKVGTALWTSDEKALGLKFVL